MANTRVVNLIDLMQKNIIAVAAIVVVLMLIIPLPAVLLDFFMAVNLGISIIILLNVLYISKSSNFSSFPRVILFVTLFGLGINVSSTRLILTQGMKFNGRMVRAFSSFVVGGSGGNEGIVVGMVIFVILIVIQAIVITKGATRVSEVAARFALDSMNSKMFDVENEVNSGAITSEEAAKRKAEIRRESDFYSAMDGSSKFVSGNVKAGIFITVINLFAGVITGMVLRREPFQNAVTAYCRLTIGDGLLSQLPSLLLSFATGLIVTGSNTDEVLSAQVKREFSISGQVYCIGGGAMALLGFVPGMPWYILIPLGVACALSGYRLIRFDRQTREKKLAAEAAAKSGSQTGGSPEDVSPVVPLDPLSLELGYALIPLVDKEKGAELLERVVRIRREAALDLGLVVPSIRIIDNMTLEPSEYSFKIRGIEAGRSKIRLGYYMCMNTGGVTEEIQGEKTTDPAFGMPAVWVPEERRVEAERAGYAVVDPPTIIATHLTEIIKNHAAEILGRQEVAAIINKIKERNPVVVEEVILKGDRKDDNKFSYGEIEKILQGLLREQVSIRNMVVILETIANYVSITHNPWILIEKVRESLGLQICMQYADNKRTLSVMNLSQKLSEKLLEHKVEPPDLSRPFVAFDPVDGRRWIRSISDAFVAMQNRNLMPIVLCASEVRQLVKTSTEREIPGLIVLSINEVMAAGNSINLEVLGEINEVEDVR
ncbi:FHIPEP family type III secretion protein [Treponema parvum]|uniref:FHIPEP family type III secretion protein n=1 Tax=Treponema parvum TaxID=138851 RepID=A0A975ICI2_9SPIR|nr:flagellar biosynthesis protein FlhA [Treponema parvum]QTQ11743.1 FHIPEP family type III secretion protein [Treponema parvum]QTQ16311.1 FHIPEP family type III secretion protein [Treponema parvum]